MTEHDNGRVPWLGINAYGVFIGVLVLLVGVRYLVNPTGYILSAAGHTGYLITGPALIYSYARTRVDVEVFASVALFISNLLILVKSFIGDGFDVYNSLLTIALGLVVAARIRALLNGGTFVLPRWER